MNAWRILMQRERSKSSSRTLWERSYTLSIIQPLIASWPPTYMHVLKGSICRVKKTLVIQNPYKIRLVEHIK